MIRIRIPSVSGRVSQLEWQPQAENATVTPLLRGALDPDVTTMLVHDSSGNPESKACPVDPLGAKESFKNPPQHLGRNSGTCVSDRDRNALLAGVPPRHVPRPETKMPTTEHGSEGVADEIIQHLADVTLITGDLNIFSILSGDGDACIVEPGTVQT